ncbi:hypothetical protein RJ639_014061 [Escallonia herrerae]|uniref:NAC domain-containing protein n=1 Tax=Escallonia herrerae TaxID=1293975 RepID=A0AA88VHQ8_9ASTE|nr:hypothetical protein RJ639_014061 [Escallonia herrerae]
MQGTILGPNDHTQLNWRTLSILPFLEPQIASIMFSHAEDMQIVKIYESRVKTWQGHIDKSEVQQQKAKRFHPSDEELIVHYLINKINSRPLPASVIAEIELYNYNPWELPSLFSKI